MCALLAITLLFSGCGSGGGSGVNSGGGASASTGKVNVSLTDAPTTDLDQVWVTVKEIRFHKDDFCDDPDDGGWLRYTLVKPVTLDLAALNNGIWNTLWDGIVLPVGHYQQIRVILESTATIPSPSWQQATGLSYYNQVNDDGNIYPLIIPAPKNGIKLIGSFRVTSATPLHIVVDFDVSHDVVESGSGKYILKPRLKYFVVSTQETAAITGTVRRPDGSAFANYTGVKVVINAEASETISLSNTSITTVMGIKRSTTVRPDGTFALYPLPANLGKSYDLVVRGTGVRTMILRDVPAVPGTIRDDPSMFAINLRHGNDYLVSAQVVNAKTNPYEPVLGSSVGFYQTLPGPGEIPYLIRFRHVNPLFGTFGSFPLAKGNLLVSAYNANNFIQTFNSVQPLEGPDSYAAYAAAPFFWTSGPMIYSPSDSFNRFLLDPQYFSSAPDCDMDDDGEDDLYPDKGYYIVSGGLVVDHIRKSDLEKGGYEFQSSNSNGQDIKSHGKNDKVKLDNRKPTKIKFKK
jgi:hypothetical protein